MTKSERRRYVESIYDKAMGEFPETNSPYRLRIGILAEFTSPKLLSLTRSEDVSIAQAAVWVFSKTRSANLVNHLLAIVADSGLATPVRRSASSALYDMQLESIVHKVCRYAADPNSHLDSVAKCMVIGIVAADTRIAVSRFLASYLEASDEDVAVRISAAEAISEQYLVERTIFLQNILIKYLNDGESQIQYICCEALSESSDPYVLDPLRLLLAPDSNSSAEIRSSVKSAMRQIKKRLSLNAATTMA